MYIAMNRFKVLPEETASFEQVWKTRESYLGELEGFIEFHLLKGPEKDNYTLYATHTLWKTYGHFEAWTKSEQFRKAHARAGDKSDKKLYEGHPEFEGFSVILEESASQARKPAAE